MAIEIINTKYTKIDFPKLMIASDNEGDTIVFMIDEFGKGNGMASNHPSWDYKGELFYSTGDWKIENFKDYNETLTIKNK